MMRFHAHRIFPSARFVQAAETPNGDDDTEEAVDRLPVDASRSATAAWTQHWKAITDSEMPLDEGR